MAPPGTLVELGFPYASTCPDHTRPHFRHGVECLLGGGGRGRFHDLDDLNVDHDYGTNHDNHVATAIRGSADGPSVSEK
jgi:hypothetical protein